MWKQDGSTLIVLAALYDDLISGRAEPAKVSAEMRQHEDRHGLNPKAMLNLRWRIVADELGAARTGKRKAAPEAGTAAKARLRAVKGAG